MKTLVQLYLSVKRSLMSYCNSPEYLLTIDFDNLLDLYDVDINYQDESGKTLLHLAAIDGCVDAVQFFIVKGIDVNIRDNKYNTALYCAILYHGMDRVNKEGK